MDWNRIEPWDYIAVNVASEYHRKYDMVEADDIKQSLYQWFLEHPNKLDEWEAIGHKDAKNLIYRSLRNQALDYCQKWKAKSVGYEVSDLFYYESDMVEALLPAVLRGEFGISHKLNLAGPSRPPAPAEGGNMMAMMVEVDAAYEKLSIEDRTVLFYKYAESLDYGAIAAEMKLGSEDAARMHHNRAIRKLVIRLGGFKPFSDRDVDKSTEPHEGIESKPDTGEEYDAPQGANEDEETLN